MTENQRSGGTEGQAPLSRAELERLAAAGELDTVLVAFTDMQGRLMGKREQADFFVSESINHSGTVGEARNSCTISTDCPPGR